MKKRKILVLFPLVGLLLTGCDFNETFTKVKEWVSDNIYHPVKDFIDGKTGGDEKEKEDEGGKEEEKTVKRIVVESYPESVAQNGTIAASSVSVRVFYSDNTEEVKPAEKVTIDTSTPGDNVPMTVEFGGKTDTVTVKVIAESEVVHVNSIKYDTGGVYTVDVGGELQVNIVVDPEDATDKTCTFTSSDETIATVTNSGLVKGVKAGSVTIHIVSNDNPEAKKDLNLTVRAEAAGLPAKTSRNYDKLASGVTLQNGEKINIAGAIGEKYYVLPTYETGNNIKAKEIAAENEALVVDEAYDLTVIKNANDTYSFMQADGKYLAATGGTSGNQLKAVDTLDEKAQFNVTVVDGYTQIVNPTVGRGSLCLNPNSGNPIFSCYGEIKYEKYALYHNGQGTTGPVAVEGVKFTADTYEVEVGSTVEVIANVTPATADDKEVSYSLKDVVPEGCVELTGHTLKGNAIGTAKIVATSHANPELKAEATVKVIDKIVYNYGTAEAPLTVAEAYALVEAQNPTAEKMFVKGVVKSNAAWSSQYKNVDIVLTDGEHDFTVFRAATFPEGFNYEGITKDSLVGATVTATGTGKIYNTTHELDAGCTVLAVEFPVAKDIASVDSITGPTEFALNAVVSPDMFTANVTFTDETKGTAKVTAVELDTSVAGQKNAILTIEGWKTPYELPVTVLGEALNYGTAEAPLTVAEAYALVEAENPTTQAMYVKGTVKSNAAWSTKYKNVDIVLTDGEHDFTIFRTATFPEGFDYEGITKDSLVGATVTATGTGKVYNETHELDQGCVVLAVELPAAKDIASVDSITGPTEFALNAVVSPDMFTANVTFTDETKGTAKVTAVELDTSVAGQKNAILTIEGWKTPYELPVTVLGEALNYGTAEAPLTVAEAYALVEAENPTTQAMYVKGTVKSNAAWSTKYKNVDIVLTDGEHDFTIFRTATFPEGFDYEGITKDSLVGATVTATGTGKVYNDTHELDQGCVVLAIEGLPEPATPVSIQSVSAPESIEQGATLSPSDVTLTVLMSDESEKEFKATSVELDTSAIGDAVEGTAYLDNLSKTFTIKVVEKQTPPTTAYKDATMTAGTNGSKCTVNGIDGIKVGTGKADGNMTITVPSGSTEVKFYAVAWKGAAGSVNVAISSGTVSPSSIDLIADDGLSSNSPFTLVETDLEKFVYSITLSGVEEEATITISSGTARRFAVWSAQYK